MPPIWKHSTMKKFPFFHSFKAENQVSYWGNAMRPISWKSLIQVYTSVTLNWYHIYLLSVAKATSNLIINKMVTTDIDNTWKSTIVKPIVKHGDTLASTYFFLDQTSATIFWTITLLDVFNYIYATAWWPLCM